MAWPIASLVAFAVSALLAWRLFHPRSPLYLVDTPNERSLHTAPIPRTGGLAILSGLAAGIATLSLGIELPVDLLWLGAAVLTVAAISLWDDWRGLDAGIRLFAHIGAALLILYTDLAPRFFEVPALSLALTPAIGVALSLLFLVWAINLYNFMDGVNGLAGGMAVFGFGFFALLGAMAEAPVFAALAALVAAASAGFLVFNFGQARIFMGDTGSASLGLMMGAFTLWAARAQIFPVWIGVLVFSPFFVDATLTLLRRLWRRERVWQAHKTHYYQRLVVRGWSHRRVAAAAYVLMALAGLSALLSPRLNSLGQWLLIGAWTSLYAILAIAIDRRRD